MIPATALNADTKVVFTNAMYLDADWQFQFDADNTVARDFQLLSGETVSSDSMTNLLDIGHTRESYFDIVELPYVGGELSMLLIVPDTGSFSMLEADLSSSLMNDALDNLQTKAVSLEMPKFDIFSQLTLGDVLRNLGVVSAFSGTADFGLMTDTAGIAIDDVLHKSFIKVDEQGTEAAAATGVVFGVTSVPEVDVSLSIDRPFVFIIRDNKTNNTVFMGRVVTPE